MADDEIEKLKRLPPDERIRRLRELEEKNEREIDKAQKLIKESAVEMEEKEEQIKQIPIPQLKAVDISELFSGEEKQMFATKRYEEVPKEEKKILEETVAAEEPKLTEEQKIEAERQYQIRQLEEVPTENIYGMLRQYEGMSSLTKEQRERISAAGYVMHQREEQIQRGEYGRTSEEIKKIVNCCLNNTNQLKYNR